MDSDVRSSFSVEDEVGTMTLCQRAGRKQCVCVKCTDSTCTWVQYSGVAASVVPKYPEISIYGPTYTSPDAEFLISNTPAIQISNQENTLKIPSPSARPLRDIHV